MMTGQPYKSPEKVEGGDSSKTEGTPSTSPASPSFSAAVRGVSTISARLQRQRLANQVYKDAWTASDPTFRGTVTPAELEKVAAAVGLELTAEDVQELIGPDAGHDGVVSCE